MFSDVRLSRAGAPGRVGSPAIMPICLFTIDHRGIEFRRGEERFVVIHLDRRRDHRLQFLGVIFRVSKRDGIWAIDHHRLSMQLVYMASHYLFLPDPFQVCPGSANGERKLEGPVSFFEEYPPVGAQKDHFLLRIAPGT